ncbi:MAG: type II secretion system minor pseudopilin GspK [Steroidobacteraceae bacterium]
MRRERGVALLTAIILVALATIVAAGIAFQNGMTARRTTSAFMFDQGIQFAAATEAIAAYALREDRKNGGVDDYSESWARPYGPVELIPGSGIWLEARLDDAQGRFNVNNLVDAEGKARPEAIGQLERLLATLGLEPKWATLLADWIDADDQPIGFMGGEDTLYLAQSPAYRAPNAPIVSVSELLALPGFGIERYTKLAPYLSALPPGTPLNVCTAAGIVIDSMTDEQEYGVDEERLAKMRETGCFPTKADLQAKVRPDLWVTLQYQVSDKSEYFRLRSFVGIGTTEFALYSLLKREATGARPILRTYGTD